MSDEEISQLAPMAGAVVVKFADALPQHCGGVASKAPASLSAVLPGGMSTRLAALPPE
jgi:hypothetical protein